MTSTAAVRFSRPEVQRALSATEARRAFHDRVLDGIREFLEAHAMRGKTGHREFYEFEKALHERLREVERQIVTFICLSSSPTVSSSRKPKAARYG